MRLPITVAGQKLDVDTIIMDRDLKPRRLLLIDDEAPVRQMYGKMLERSGHKVTTARNGTEALHRLREAKSHTYDLVITDRALPDMSGDQIAIEGKKLHPKLPFIMLTGFGDMMKARGEHPDGVDLIVSKPTTAADLQVAIRSVTEKERDTEPRLSRRAIAQLADER